MGFGQGEGFTAVVGAIPKAIAKALTIPAPVLGDVETEVWSGGLLSAFDLTIVAPTVSKAVAEDHSGGALTSTPSLSVPVPTVAGVAELVE